jgi:hypothetical protein
MKNTPGLAPHQLRRHAVHVIPEDLAEITRLFALKSGEAADVAGGLVDRHIDELHKWRFDDELSPTALAIVAVLSVFRGLRGGERGCGIQAPVESWAKLLGRSVRMVSYAFAELDERDWVKRHRRLVEVKWTHRWVAKGVEKIRVHERADIYAVAYLSTKAMHQIRRRGETKKLELKDGKRRWVLYAAGIVGGLLRKLSGNLRTIARRVAEVRTRCTPSFGVETQRKAKQDQRQRGQAPLSARSVHPGHGTTGPPGPDGRGHGAPPDGAGMGISPVYELELLELFKSGALTPAVAWPELWRRANQPYHDRRSTLLGSKIHVCSKSCRDFDMDARKWLQRSAEKFIAYFSKLELQRRVASPRGARGHRAR